MTDQVNENPQATDKEPMSPEIQARFDKIYAESKQRGERAKLLEHQLLENQGNTKKIMEKLDAAEKRDVIDTLRQQIKAARDNGDDDQVEALKDKLDELKIEAKIEKKIQPKLDEKKEPEIDPYANMFSKSEATITTKWANETDEDGELIRPWATTPGHPKGQAAADYLYEVMTDSKHEDLSIKEKLALVDEKFAKKKVADRSDNAVLKGNLTQPRELKQDKLSDDEKKVAYRIFSRLDKAEAEKAYLEGKQIAKRAN